MRTQTLPLLSLCGRVVSGRAVPALQVHAHAARVAACPSTPLHAHASTQARSHATPTAPTRSITTKTKSRGPASPMTERELDGGREFIVEPDVQELPMPNALSPAFVLQDAAKWSHKTAMECSMTGRGYTYGELVDGAMRFGGALQRLCGGDCRGKTVAILAPNCPEYPMAFLGTMITGATVTPFNCTYTPSEIAHHLADSGAEALVVDALLEPFADAALKLLQKEIPVIVNGPSKHQRPNLREMVKDANIPFAKQVEVSMESTATLPYSSGTTGKPKGVCISHRAFVNSLTLFHHPTCGHFTTAEGDNQEVMVGLLPFFHIYGMMVIMASGIMHGAKTITMPQFDPKVFLGILAKNKVTKLHLVPPLLNFLATSPVVHPSLLSNINTILCGAAPVPTTSATLLKEKAQRPIFFQEGFGMTETLCTHITPPDQERLGWCGKLMPNVRGKVVDLDTGLPLPPGEKGELCVDTPGMMSCYHNNPEATRDSFDSDGWFKTGDVAIYDKDGFFSIVDRIKELIKVKGTPGVPIRA
ncbi:hypothetical protein O3P69_004717 [Scylla paramamosain]|uniref:AMP-dependent synthetase/ligase domain-containing protein n=1 Tax=Scylla paramamosain TaxID=85552 RepID=A0AAW0UC56_SCYPA